MSDTKSGPIPPSQIYIAVSGGLLTPVLFWPALILVFNNDMNQAQHIHQLWMITASSMLIAAATADSIIKHKTNSLWPIFACGWIFLSVIGIGSALRLPEGTWLLGSLFAMHSLRPAISLWRGHHHWQLWPAWCRDTLAAMAIFTWPMLNMI